MNEAEEQQAIVHSLDATLISTGTNRMPHGYVIGSVKVGAVVLSTGARVSWHVSCGACNYKIGDAVTVVVPS